MSHCPRCGAAFICGMADGPEPAATGEAQCWCMQLPPLPAEAADATNQGNSPAAQSSCLCRACLLAAISSSRQ